MKEINYSNYYWQNELVRLRGMEPEDWEGHFYNRFDTPARRLLNCEVELPPTIEEAKTMAEKWSSFNSGAGLIMFTIETLAGENVGAVNLNSVDERNGTFSIGMQIDRDHRGKGYGTAAMQILLRYAFLERRLNKYYGYVVEGNVASATMLQKLGCEQEGVRKQMIYTDGKYLDQIMFGLTKDQFLQTKKSTI